MDLTPAQIEAFEAMRGHMTCREIAAELGLKPDHVRQICSRYGIANPKRIKLEKENEQIRRFWGHGEPKTIAEFIGISCRALRMRIKRMGLTTNQTKLELQ